MTGRAPNNPAHRIPIPMSDAAPLLTTVSCPVPAATLAADAEHNLAVAPFTGSINAASYIPDTTLTGADTNSRTLTLVNKGQAGAGTTIVATKAFTAAINAPADDETALTLSGNAANLLVNAGDVLAWQSTHIGTGLADPGGLAKIQFLRS